MERDGEEACKVEVATAQTEDVAAAIGSNNWLLHAPPWETKSAKNYQTK